MKKYVSDSVVRRHWFLTPYNVVEKLKNVTITNVWADLN